MSGASRVASRAKKINRAPRSKTTSRDTRSEYGHSERNRDARVRRRASRVVTKTKTTKAAREGFSRRREHMRAFPVSDVSTTRFLRNERPNEAASSHRRGCRTRETRVSSPRRPPSLGTWAVPIERPRERRGLGRPDRARAPRRAARPRPRQSRGPRPRQTRRSRATRGAPLREAQRTARATPGKDTRARCDMVWPAWLRSRAHAYAPIVSRDDDDARVPAPRAKPHAAATVPLVLHHLHKPARRHDARKQAAHKHKTSQSADKHTAPMYGRVYL